MTVPLVANTVIHSGIWLRFIDTTDWIGNHYALGGYDIVDSAHSVIQGSPFCVEWVTCYSFYPTKPICSCDGGMICTNDANAAEWLRKATQYGRNTNSSKMKNSWEYDIEFPGWKMHMTDIQAAIALNQLRKYPELEEMRKDVLHRYNTNLGTENTSTYLYRINVNDRDEFIPWMKEKGIECGVHFAPLHLMQAYKDHSREVSMEKTEREGRTTVSLPLYHSLLVSEIDYISDMVLEWRKAHGEIG